MGMVNEETAADEPEDKMVAVQQSFEKDTRNAEAFQVICGIAFFGVVGGILGPNAGAFQYVYATYDKWRLSFLAILILKGLRFLYALMAMCCYKHSHWMCRN